MCHRCEHQDAIRAGKFRGKRFEETPCATCDWREPSSVFTIPFDDARAAATPVDGEQPFPEEAEAEELKLPVSVMTTALAMIMALRARTRDALIDRYLGKLYREIADMQNVTVAAIEMRHKRALERWPELRALFPLKVAKQRRRRPHCRRGGRISRAEQGGNGPSAGENGAVAPVGGEVAEAGEDVAAEEDVTESAE
jgi:hypothetical protein